MANASNKRKGKRQPVTVDAMLYDQDGKPIGPCTLRNVSQGGAQLELAKEIELPPTFTLVLTRSGEVRRNCQTRWQFATVAGVRFE